MVHSSPVAKGYKYQILNDSRLTFRIHSMILDKETVSYSVFITSKKNLVSQQCKDGLFRLTLKPKSTEKLLLMFQIQNNEFSATYFLGAAGAKFPLIRNQCMSSLSTSME